MTVELAAWFNAVAASFADVLAADAAAPALDPEPVTRLATWATSPTAAAAAHPVVMAHISRHAKSGFNLRMAKT